MLVNVKMLSQTVVSHSASILCSDPKYKMNRKIYDKKNKESNILQLYYRMNKQTKKLSINTYVHTKVTCLTNSQLACLEMATGQITCP